MRVSQRTGRNTSPFAMLNLRKELENRRQIATLFLRRAPTHSMIRTLRSLYPARGWIHGLFRVDPAR
jgi:hypothetical protein